jgi:hypothetical protein
MGVFIFAQTPQPNPERIGLSPSTIFNNTLLEISVYLSKLLCILLNMPHSYASEYPRDTNCEDGIKKLFETFNEISDTPLVHEKYADLFTDDATIIVAGKEIVGKKGSSFSRRGHCSRRSRSSYVGDPIS